MILQLAVLVQCRVITVIEALISFVLGGTFTESVCQLVYIL